MSLDVPDVVLERAERGEVTEAEFIDVIRRSLPYAWQVVTNVAADLDAGTAPYADHAAAPPTEAHRGQLLRALASDAIRAALERHFGIGLAFQNCHRVAAFRPAEVGGTHHRVFVSARGQLLNQSPELRNC
jgi:hypothetical protein